MKTRTSPLFTALPIALSATMAAAFFCPATRAAAGPGSLVLPVADTGKVETWTVKSASADQANITSNEGLLRIDAKVAIAGTHQVGHEAYPTGRFELLLAKPLPLDPQASRIEFEAIGSEWKSWNTRETQSRLRPLIRDAQGEILVYNAFPDEGVHLGKNHPATKRDSTRWRRWLTRNFGTSEAGAATQDIYEVHASTPGFNNAPDAPLTFIGFEVEIRDRRVGGVKNASFVLGDVRVLGGLLPQEDPWVYADTFFDTAGSWTFGYEVTNRFQGPAVFAGRRSIPYDPESLASRRQRLSFVLGPSDNYWINYRVIRPDGTVAASDRFRHQIYNRDELPAPAALDAAAPPSVGALRINPDRTGDGVYPAGTKTFDVTARVFSSGSAADTSRRLDWELIPYDFPEVLEKGSSPLPANTKAAFADIAIRAGETQAASVRDSFRLRVRLSENGKQVDEVVYHLGRVSAVPEVAHSRPIPLNDREFIKKHAYNRVTLTKLSSVRFTSEDEAMRYYEQRMDEIQRITPHMTWMLDVRDLQTLPGVYNFSLLDRLFAAAAARGMTFTIRFAHIDDEGEFLWVKYSRQVNYDGREIPEHHYGNYAVTDADYTRIWHDSYRAIYLRYGANPAFQGYYIMQPAGEFIVSDKPWEGLISGYSPPMQRSFRAWMRKIVPDIGALNRRWATEYRTWDEVSAPQPDFSLGQRPDLRMAWVDFCRFKDWYNNHYWFPESISRIRSYDPHHVVIHYGAPSMAEGISDYGHNGGNHMWHGIGAWIDSWSKHRTGWITEPHQPNKWTDYGDPAERGWVLDWSLWLAYAQSGSGFANLHTYYHPANPDLVSHYGAEMGYDRMQRYMPILNELHDAEIKRTTPKIALFQDPHTLYTKHRTTFFQRLWDLRRWFELLDRDSVTYQELPGDLSGVSLGDYRLILTNPLDEVMSEANVAKLADSVARGGASLGMTANTGRKIPERASEDFVLLRALGIAPPSGDYVLDETDVSARAVGGNPLFADGESIRFFSLADLKTYLQSDAIKVRENFWNYPYRWLPLTDYYGYYRDNRPAPAPGVEILARFSSGAPAVTRHECGKGRVVVFWGLPDYRQDNLPGFMARLARWAGAPENVSENPLPLMHEGHNRPLGRHYALIYNEQPGTFIQRIGSLPDGDWFVDDLLSEQRLGRVSGAHAREQGLSLTFDPTYSPLKILRFVPRAQNRANTNWPEKYPDLNRSAEKP